MTGKLSIVIPAYNCGKYIEECIESLREINYDSIIVVDDGSTDDTNQTVRSMTNLKIHYVYTKRVGISEARNVGLKWVDTEYVMFVDADDTLDENGVQIINEYLLKKFDVVAFGKGLETKTFTTRSFLPEQDIYFSLCGYKQYPGLITAVYSKLYRVEFLKVKSIEFNKNVSKGEDAVLNVQVFGNATTIMMVNAPLYRYRINQDSMTRGFHYDVAENYKYSSLDLYLNCFPHITKKNQNSVAVNWLLREFKSLISSKQDLKKGSLKMMKHFYGQIYCPLYIDWTYYKLKQKLIYVLLLCGLYNIAALVQRFEKKNQPAKNYKPDFELL
ncbi:glycosyltransferase family 2 protein [Weissella cibaria]|uniref:glycosyltransferase family 2 protein n=1 Tax=Weissella cibaria TaxID=137591 RepID=UPI0011969805|nr:glycosyltransferase family A protein [Weissella cibaria]TVV25973.1 glycosyltransferase family 2 protein [Weissella cibaria]